MRFEVEGFGSIVRDPGGAAGLIPIYRRGHLASMRLPPRALLLALSTLAFAAIPARAQLSMVPAHHPVYGWLRYQETLGNLEGYPHEALPLTREEIVGFLDQIGRSPRPRSNVDVRLLNAFRSELSSEGIEASARENYVTGTLPFVQRVRRIHQEDMEPRLIAEVGDHYAFAFDVIRTPVGVRRVDEEGGAPETMRFSESKLRSIVAIGERLGFYVEAANMGMEGDNLLALDPRHGRTATVLVHGGENPVYAEAYVSARIGDVAVDIAHGPVRYGAGAGPSLFLGVESSTHDWLRVRLGSRALRYTALAGSLISGPSFLDADSIAFGADTVLTRFAPERWLAMHRLTFVPSEDLEMSVTQAVLYTGRRFDAGLHSPLGPALAGDGGAGADNLLWMLDAVGRPRPGVSLHGALLLDALDLSDGGTVTGVDVGAHVALAGGWEAEARHVRLGPSLYAAADSLHALQQRGYPLGHPLGPNAEESTVSLAKWLPIRSRASVALGVGRRGLNPVGPGGGITNVGGDLLLPPVPGTSFLEGAEVQSYRRVEVSAVVEPVRGFQLELEWRHRWVTEGLRLPDRDEVAVRFAAQSAIVEGLHHVVATIWR